MNHAPPGLRVVDLIARKRDGLTLSRDEIGYVVDAATAGRLPDYQMAALLMAIVLRGMTATETAWLTDAMLASGDRLDLSDLPGPTVGKHSTGGVGDKVSIALAPLVAACGVIVPKMSGRGLGHTGGTVDKLESIPGYRTDLTIDEFRQVLRRVGTSIIGQTATLAPADRVIYALRDATATVESVPLIAASIMSKKLAEGSRALLLDVKCGAGAFMADLDGARGLARLMVGIGGHAGVRTEAVVTRMDHPLGGAVGNAVEVEECVRLLRGEGPGDLTALVLALAARMVRLAGREDAEAAVRRALDEGRALDVLRRMIEAHGGDPRIADDPRRLPRARHRALVPAPRAGVVTAIDARSVGRAAGALGAGRDRAGAPIDHAAGILIVARPGDRVDAGDPVLELLYNDEGRLAPAEALARRAVSVGDVPPAPSPLILDEVR